MSSARRGCTYLAVALLSLPLTGCRSWPTSSPASVAEAGLSTLDDVVLPSNQRDWSPDLAELPYAVRDGDQIHIRNVRNFRYRSDDEYIVNYINRRYDLTKLRTLDFIVVPFKTAPSLAHTMLSFGFEDGNYLGVSVEARLEKDETYTPWKGALRQYELIYVLADERDLIGRRTRHRDADVYLYPTVATPQQAQLVLVDVLARVNRLATHPEFYDTVRNNCTTNIVRHIKRLQPDALPADVRMLLPGFSDQYAYELGLLDVEGPFPVARRAAHVNRLANRYLEAADFSDKIRRR